ncbi:Uncharacterized protein TCAP_07224 [Tolypocladium capitatum]|uniref:Uncharacterized protein n=1 Tax=Tolypocladium capitatum TaxID=45235 RepID=A0A2K3Q216_9HYPO|nr:Uncharacterized protein TCAP_07224 [Tolypocladium capitatum]
MTMTVRCTAPQAETRSLQRLALFANSPFPHSLPLARLSMASRVSLFGLLSAVWWQCLAAQRAPVSFCSEPSCGNCPISAAAVEQGSSKCVIYNSDSVFRGQGFGESGKGVYTPYLDLKQPDPDCSILLRSPARTDLPDCGQVVRSFEHAACVAVYPGTSFMLQRCCARDKCYSGNRRSAKTGYGHLEGRASGGGAYYLQFSDGTGIEAAQQGFAPGAGPRRDDMTEIKRDLPVPVL